MRPTARQQWILVAAVAVALGATSLAQQTFAPHEKTGADAPPPIVWPPPPLPSHPIDFESAEERNLRLVVITDQLHQPWSVAFLPNDELLVTERTGRLRIIRH